MELYNVLSIPRKAEQQLHLTLQHVTWQASRVDLR